MAADGAVGAVGGQLLAIIPPAADATAARQFRLQRTAVSNNAATSALKMVAVNDKTLQVMEQDKPVLAYNHGTITGENVPEKDLLFVVTRPAGVRRLSWSNRFRVWGLGGIFIVNAVAYFTALERTPASLVAVLVFTYPVMVMLLSALLGLDPLTLRGLAAAGLAAGGSALAIGGTRGGATASGVALALLASLFYACYVVVGSRLLASIPTEAVARHVVGVGAALSLLWGGWRGQLTPPVTGAAWASLVIMGTVSTFVAMRAFLAGVERIGPARASVLSTLEVFVTVGLAALFLSEAVSLRQLAGAALVLFMLRGLIVWALFSCGWQRLSRPNELKRSNVPGAVT